MLRDGAVEEIEDLTNMSLCLFRSAESGIAPSMLKLFQCVTADEILHVTLPSYTG